MKKLNFKSLLAALLGLAFSVDAFAMVGELRSQDIKVPTQAMIEHQLISAPIAPSATYIISSANGSSTGAVSVTTFAHQPDVVRNLTITPTGSTANVAAGTAVIAGTDFFGNSISENFAIGSTQSIATTGAKAFKSVSSVSFPQTSGNSVTFRVGVGQLLGLKRCMAHAGDVVYSLYGGAYETTHSTGAASSTAISGNTVSLNTSLSGSDVDVYFVQNWRCFPVSE